MPDVLTDAERAMIDAFPQRKIQRLEAKIAQPAPYRWIPGKIAGEGRLVPAEPETNAERIARVKRTMWADRRKTLLAAARKGNERSAEAKRAAIAPRRLKVAKLHEAGKSTREIAAALGCARSTVQDDIKAIREGRV